jgi:lipopolysaccharide heptosyltransferase III
VTRVATAGSASSSVTVRRGAVLVHPGALGDVLLAIPALRVLRRAMRGESVVLAAEPRLAGLVHALAEADGALTLDALGVSALFAGNTPPASSPLHGARRVLSFLGARDPAFVAALSAAAPRVDVAPSTPPDGPVWQHLVQTVDASAIPPLEPVVVSPAMRAEGQALLAGAGWRLPAPLAIVHPGAGGEAKRWAAHKFARLVEALSRQGMTVAIHAGPADAAAVAAVGNATRVSCVTLHEPPLPALAGALASARLYVGNDSGVSHLAAAVGTPSVILFTDALAAWRPWSSAPAIVTIDPGHPDEADVDRVLHAADAVLNQS